EPRVHEPGVEPVVRRLTIVVDALDERGSAITNADDGNSDGSHGWPPGSDGALAAARGRSCVSVAQRRVKSRNCTTERRTSEPGNEDTARRRNRARAAPSPPLSHQ